MPCAEDRLAPSVHHLVGLAEQLAPLASARRSRSCTLSLARNSGRHLAGERALVLPVAVLRAERDRRCLSASIDGLHRAEVGERRVHDDVDRARSRPSSSEVRQLLHDLDRLEVVVVHLPVAADQRLAVVLSHRAFDALSQGCEAGQVAQLEQLERRAAAGATRGRLRSARPNCATRRGAVAAADDGERRRRRPPPRRRCGCRPRSARPRTRPSGRSRTRCGRRAIDVGERGRRAGPDVEALPAVGDRRVPHDRASRRRRRSPAR